MLSLKSKQKQKRLMIETTSKKFRGRYTENAPLGEKGWFRCGGTAEVLFKPADEKDLVYFYGGLP